MKYASRRLKRQFSSLTTADPSDVTPFDTRDVKFDIDDRFVVFYSYDRNADNFRE